MVKGKPWKKGEIERLRREFPSGNLIRLSEELGRSMNSIRLKASRIGLKRSYVLATDGALIRCYGRDFDESCVERCPMWSPCLETYTEYEKEGLIKEWALKKIRVTRPVLAERILEIIREANA